MTVSGCRIDAEEAFWLFGRRFRKMSCSALARRTAAFGVRVKKPAEPSFFGFLSECRIDGGGTEATAHGERFAQFFIFACAFRRREVSRIRLRRRIFIMRMQDVP